MVRQSEGKTEYVLINGIPRTRPTVGMSVKVAQQLNWRGANINNTQTAERKMHKHNYEDQLTQNAWWFHLINLGLYTLTLIALTSDNGGES